MRGAPSQGRGGKPPHADKGGFRVSRTSCANLSRNPKGGESALQTEPLLPYGPTDFLSEDDSIMNLKLKFYKRLIRLKMRQNRFGIVRLYDGFRGEQGRRWYSYIRESLSYETIATPHYFDCPAAYGESPCTCGMAGFMPGRSIAVFWLGRFRAWGRVLRETLRLGGSWLWRRTRREPVPPLAFLLEEIERNRRQSLTVVRRRYAPLAFAKTISPLTWSQFRRERGHQTGQKN